MNKISALTTPVEFDKSDFPSLLSLTAGTVIARQYRLGEFMGKDDWRVDVTNHKITFGKHLFKKREFDIGLIGTESEYSNTWLWGWANTESGLSEDFVAPSLEAKQALQDCREFGESQLELDELCTGHNLSTVTVGIFDKNVCYYRCPYDGGAMFALIEGLPESIFEPLSLNEIMHRHLDIISSVHCIHRLLAAGLLHQNGYTFTDNGDHIVCEYEGQVLRFDFEKSGEIIRTSNISLNHI